MKNVLATCLALAALAVSLLSSAFGGPPQIITPPIPVLLNPTATQTIAEPGGVNAPLQITQSSGLGITNFSISNGSGTALAVGPAANNEFVQLGGPAASHITAGTANDDISGVLTCAASTVTKTFSGAFTSTPTIVVSDETAAGGARVSAKSATAFTVTCSGATDVVDYWVRGNPN